MLREPQNFNLSKPFFLPVKDFFKAVVFLLLYLFKVYVDISFTEWTRKYHKMGLKLDGKCIHHILFADDQVILVEDADDTTYIFFVTYTEWKLKNNVNKTE